MKSKISCWRLVRSMMAWLPEGLDVEMERTCVRTLAPFADGHKAELAREAETGSLGRQRYTGVRRPPARRPETDSSILAPLCARGGIGRRARLRALSCVNGVVVRVHSGA